MTDRKLKKNLVYTRNRLEAAMGFAPSAATLKEYQKALEALERVEAELNRQQDLSGYKH